MSEADDLAISIWENFEVALDKAFLVALEELGEERWITKSVIHDDSEVFGGGENDERAPSAQPFGGSTGKQRCRRPLVGQQGRARSSRVRARGAATRESSRPSPTTPTPAKIAAWSGVRALVDTVGVLHLPGFEDRT